MSRTISATADAIPATARKAIYDLPAWFIPTLKYLVATTFALIALGGSVRIMNAGLACPDWPLCFGDIIPDYHPQVYFEFIHRALAGVVAIVAVTLQYVLIFRSTAPKALKAISAGSVILLLTQVVFGGLTVLWQLHSKVVAAHLGMGIGFFSLLLWMYLELSSKRELGYGPKWLMGVAVGLFLAIYGQILLGGMVASHFASLVCTDFPTCHGQWFPTFSGIIGLHVIHRLGGYIVFAVGLIGMLVILNRSSSARMRKLAGWFFALICVQIGIGIANVLLHTPPLIAVLHLATATLILSLALRMVHLSYRGTPG